MSASANVQALQDKPLCDAGRSYKKRPAQKRDQIEIKTIRHDVGAAWENDDEIEMLGDALISWMEGTGTGTIPLLKAFLTRHRITRRTVKALKERNEYFSQCWDLAQDMQEVRLLEHGLESRTPTFAIFLLKCNHRYSETAAFGQGGSTGRITFSGFDDDKTEIVLVPKRMAEDDLDNNDINN